MVYVQSDCMKFFSEEVHSQAITYPAAQQANGHKRIKSPHTDDRMEKLRLVTYPPVMFAINLPLKGIIHNVCILFPAATKWDG